MRTLDRNHLATHPAGDEKAVVSLSAASRDENLAPNPDGTRPQVTLRATGETYLDVLTVLAHLHEDGGESMLQLLLSDTVAQSRTFMARIRGRSASMIREAAEEVVTPFRTFEAKAVFEVADEDGSATRQEVLLELTAPSIKIGVGAVLHMTTPEKLMSAAIAMSPLIDDDYDDGYYDDEEEECDNEVLVVS
jgi:hypothetical protein